MIVADAGPVAWAERAASSAAPVEAWPFSTTAAPASANAAAVAVTRAASRLVSTQGFSALLVDGASRKGRVGRKSSCRTMGIITPGPVAVR